MPDRIRQIKLFIKLSIVVGVLLVFVVLGIFVRPAPNIENMHMKKWLSLTQQQRTEVIKHATKDETTGIDTMVACVTKIADLPHSHTMMIRDAISLCYNGMKINSVPDEE